MWGFLCCHADCAICTIILVFSRSRWSPFPDIYAAQADKPSAAMPAIALTIGILLFLATAIVISDGEPVIAQQLV
jgi:hypothetical protein